jgi:hypothetical protein
VGGGDQAELNRGNVIDPRAGQITLAEYAAQWQAAQMHRPSTAEATESQLRRHVLPTFGHRPIGSLRPSEIRAWVKGLSGKLAPTRSRPATGCWPRGSCGRRTFRDTSRPITRRMSTMPCMLLDMSTTGDLRISSRGQMSLPASARHRWGLDDGGDVGYLDLGDALVLVPGGVDQLRAALLDAVSEDIWESGRNGFGDPDLADQ